MTIDEINKEQDLPPLKRALIAVKDMRERLEAAERAQKEPIAIIGMGCRFPGEADTLERYWQLLRDGVDAISEVPNNRWNVDQYYHPDPDAAGKTYVREGGFVGGVDLFDAEFFGITPREAASMDPQQRLLLEVSWHALEHSGIDPQSLGDSSTGVFIGISASEYTQIDLKTGGADRINPYSGTGGAFSVAAGRLSFFLKLHGPAIALDTACSSSLVAIDLAVQYLRAKKCHCALAGGVNLMLSPESTIYLSKVRALSPEGRCKTFDAAADGYGRGEGCGIIVMKRLRDAIENNDRILAVIRGSAVNHDGRSSGLTVPNGAAQQQVIKAALADADLIPDDVHFVEAHGTGTELGDPIEIRALSSIFSRSTPLTVGTVKTNIGHLESAAGVAAVIKVALAFQNKIIPPNLHFTHPSPHIPWDDILVQIPTVQTPWPDGVDRPIAGVSSFGFSGTNAHLIMQAASPQETLTNKRERPLHIVPLSAQHEAALGQLVNLYASHVRKNRTQSLAEIAHTAGTGRTHFQKRLAVIAGDKDQLMDRLDAYAHGGSAPGVIGGESVERELPSKIAFLFTGQGAQYIGMGRMLYETQPTFRKILDQCDDLLHSGLNQSLISLLYPSLEEDVEVEARLNQTQVTQPALFALEVALAQLWRTWGIEPSAVMGHSVGEYAAACVAGVFSLEQGLKLIAERGRLIQSLSDKGRMAAVFTDVQTVEDMIAGQEDAVAIAAVNGPANTVISGDSVSIERIISRLETRGIGVHPLNVSHAFHSPLMEPILDSFEKFASEVDYSSPRIKFISNMTGQLVRGKEIGTGRWWRRHVRQPVRFEQSIAAMSDMGIDTFLEIGPNPVLLGMAAKCLPEGDFSGLPSLRRGRDDWEQMLESLGKLYVQGFPVDWKGFDKDYHRAKRSLPGYPFQRKRHWLAGRKSVSAASTHPAIKTTLYQHPLVGERVQSPALKDSLFRSVVSSEQVQYLQDHNVFGMTIFPMAGFLEMACSAAQSVFAPRPFELQTFTIEEPLFLNEDPVELQIIVSLENESSASIKIVSQKKREQKTKDPWNLHITAQVKLTEEITSITGRPADDLSSLQAKITNRIDFRQFYQNMQARGFDYGTAFQSVTKLWQGDNESLGYIRLSPEMETETGDYLIHPTLLDGCLQVLGTREESGDRLNEDVYLPIAIGRTRLSQPIRSACWSHARFTEGSVEGADMMYADIRIYDEHGEVSAEIDRLVLKKADSFIFKQARMKRLDKWLYHIDWQKKEVDETPIPSGATEGRYVLFSDRQGVGEDLARRLKARGQHCLLVYPGTVYREMGEDSVTLDAEDPMDYERLFAGLRQDGSSPVAGVIHLWTIECDPNADEVEAIGKALQMSCGSVLNTVRELVKTPIAPFFKLFLATRGSQTVGADPTAPALMQMPLWGLGRVIAREHPELRCTQIDLDKRDSEDMVDLLYAELNTVSREDQLAYRGHDRYAARLVQRDARMSQHPNRLPIPASEAYRLCIRQKGLLESLEFEAAPRQTPGPGMVELRILMSSLNFRDVLNALGMYPGKEILLGSECVGRITALGEGVQGRKVGDTVIALAEGCFGNYVCTRADWLMAKPSGLSDEEAATIPIVFLTAYYGLIHLAGMKKGDRVLIHAAAGGVGMAAVQLAQWVGAEVYATAGSVEKQEYLKAMGVTNVMHSRNLDFAEEIMAATNGIGVDIVLNALIGDFIPKSLSVLSPGGRFIELGKAEIWDAEEVARVNPECRYTAFDISEFIVEQPRLINEMYRHILSGFKAGNLGPLPLHLFPIDDAVGAFRFMAQARHIGKIVLSPDLSDNGEKGAVDRIRPDGAYLIAGGMGGIGLNIAEWMVQKGARRLILMGRSAPESHALEAMRTMEEKNAKVTVFQGDVSNPADVQRLFGEIDSAGDKLRGIVHAAGVLDDGVLAEQNWSRFERVLSPKVYGAWLLHRHSQKAPLDFFVLFSSVASVLGTAGQSNYATANAFLDGLAQFRHASGLPALSINWGPWDDIGMTSKQDDKQRLRIALGGIDLIAPEKGLQVFGRLVGKNTDPNVVAMPVNWSKALKSYGDGNIPPFLEAVAANRDPASKESPDTSCQSELLEKLEAAVRSERQEIMMAAVSEKVAKVMGLDSSHPMDVRKPFDNLGLDSLMAVELKNELTLIVDGSLQTSLMYDYPTIEKLSTYLLGLVMEAGALETDRNEENTPPEPSTADKLSELESLSDEEVNRLFDQQSKGY